MKQIPLKVKEVNKELERFGIKLSKKDSVVKCEDVLKVNKEVAFFYYKEELVPTLKFLINSLVLPKVTVDMGAIKFVVNGADIMRPGIVDMGTFESGDFVVVVDVNNTKPLAVGIALMSSAEMQETSSGKVVQNIHYVGDEIWNM